MANAIQVLEARRVRRRRRERWVWDMVGGLFFLAFLRLFVDYAIVLWGMMAPWI